MIVRTIEELEKAYQDAVERKGTHLASHNQEYCYENDNSFDYSRYMSGPVDVREVWFWRDIAEFAEVELSRELEGILYKELGEVAAERDAPVITALQREWK